MSHKKILQNTLALYLRQIIIILITLYSMRVESWIKGFADADFVITDSFHGTVFSIIFNKPFISLVNVKRGASRFESILGELGLSERLISGFDKNKVETLSQKNIDYHDVNRALITMRNTSKELLNKYF